MGVPLSTGAKVVVSIVAMAEVGGGHPVGMPEVRCAHVKPCMRTCRKIRDALGTLDPGHKAFNGCREECSGCHVYCVDLIDRTMEEKDDEKFDTLVGACRKGCYDGICKE